MSVAKAALLYAVAPGSIYLSAAVAGGDAASKAAAGYHAANALGAAGAVAVAGSSGHIKRSRGAMLTALSLLSRAGHTIGIAKASGLNVFRGRGNRRHG